MNLSRFLLVVLAGAALPGCGSPPADTMGNAPPAPTAGEEERDFGRFFEGLEGTFVLLDPATGRTIRHDPERARARFLPASTYKIPNTLIALETGVASGPEFFLAWDSAAAPRASWWPAAWAGDHTLATALRYSAVWYYQELARRIGAERMQSYVDRFAYGNRDISGGIDQFWLTGGLGISAGEQVDFLRRFYFGELGLSERTTRVVKELLVLDETSAYRLSGKTGWAALGDPSEPEIGWLVGYLERGGDVYFFATNIDIRRNEDAAARLPITRAILRHLGLLPEPEPRSDGAGADDRRHRGWPALAPARDPRRARSRPRVGHPGAVLRSDGAQGRRCGPFGSGQQRLCSS